MKVAARRLLVVDDEPANLHLIQEILKDDYSIIVAKTGEQALSRAVARPDLILLDVMMPGIDGFEVCRRLKADPRTADIPIIFLTALSARDDEARGLALGAIDYIAKPISPAILRARIENYMALQEVRHWLDGRNQELERQVAERTRDLALTQDAIIFAMAALAELRDTETGNHIRRTREYIRALAERLSRHPDFASTLDQRTIEALYKAAPLHDIGKIGLPDSVLLKPGRLDNTELATMRSHPQLGRDAIARAEFILDSGTNDSGAAFFLRIAREIAYCHHEKWDGSGYPQGLAGDQIPLSARLMALADVYDALISARPYKPAMDHATAAAMIAAGSGSHFDPRVVEAFHELETTFQAIACRLGNDTMSD